MATPRQDRIERRLAAILDAGMRRREFIALVASVVLMSSRAQSQRQEGKVRLGYLAPSKTLHLLDAFKNGLRDRGYIEGQNLSIEYRFADGQLQTLDKFAAELVQLIPDVIVAVGTAAAVRAIQATGTIPIVFAPVIDPVRSGLVRSWARPGGNATGVTLYASELSQKRLDVLKETIPAIKRVAVVGNADNPLNPGLWEDTKSAGKALGIELLPVMIKGISDLDAAFSRIQREGVDALLVLSDAEFDSGRRQITRLAAVHRVPTMYEHRAFVEDGGLVSYGPNIDEVTYRAAAYVDKILKGANPADLPVEQPTKFESASRQLGRSASRSRSRSCSAPTR